MYKVTVFFFFIKVQIQNVISSDLSVIISFSIKVIYASDLKM